MIDKNPAVGRWLFIKSPIKYEFAKLGGQISKICRSRVHFTDSLGRKTFRSSFVAVCDTLEEIDTILDVNYACAREFIDLEVQHKNRIKYQFPTLDPEFT